MFSRKFFICLATLVFPFCNLLSYSPKEFINFLNQNFCEVNGVSSDEIISLIKSVDSATNSRQPRNFDGTSFSPAPKNKLFPDEFINFLKESINRRELKRNFYEVYYNLKNILKFQGVENFSVKNKLDVWFMDFLILGCNLTRDNIYSFNFTVANEKTTPSKAEIDADVSLAERCKLDYMTIPEGDLSLKFIFTSQTHKFIITYYPGDDGIQVYKVKF